MKIKVTKEIIYIYERIVVNGEIFKIRYICHANLEKKTVKTKQNRKMMWMDILRENEILIIIKLKKR